MSSDFLSKDIVHVNSSKRLSGTSSDFTIDLSQQIRIPNQYDRASLVSFSCPKSYYLITADNDSFTVTEGKTTRTIELLHGNYSFTSLATELEEELNAFGVGWVYTVLADKSVGKFFFSVTGHTSQPSFDFSGATSPYYIVGFDEAVYSFTSDVLYSVNLVNLQRIDSMQLLCNFVNGGILSTIIPDVSDFGLIQFQEPDAILTSQIVSLSNFQQCHFSLVDGDDGAIIDLNGLHFDFVFIIYQRNTYFSQMLQDKRLELLQQSINQTF